jgi:hypothetical protein
MFGTNLTVLITVPAPVTDTPTPEPTMLTVVTVVVSVPPPTEVTLSPIKQGFVVSDGSVNTVACMLGDSLTNTGTQCFFTFDVSGIPDSATIEDVTLRYSTLGETGNPFAGLGELRVYHVNYGDLATADYEHDADSSQAIQTIRSSTQFARQPRTLNPRGDTALQSSLAGDLFQIRIQFDEKTDQGNDNDIITADVQLVVTYRP